MNLSDNKHIDNFRSAALSSSGSILSSNGVLVKSNRVKKVLASSLTITSLVDCFTILVAYLLVATSFGAEEMNIDKDMHLPHANYSTELKLGNIIKIENGKYILNDKAVRIEELFEALKAAKSKSDSIIIQADKKNTYSTVNPAVLSALQAGFAQVKFAVLQEDAG